MTVQAIAVDPHLPERFITLTQQQPDPHDLLVEVKAVSINPVDTKVHAGLRKNGLAEPRVLGWDASGTVLAIGDRVSGFQVGAGQNLYHRGKRTSVGSKRVEAQKRLAALGIHVYP